MAARERCCGGDSQNGRARFSILGLGNSLNSRIEIQTAVQVRVSTLAHTYRLGYLARAITDPVTPGAAVDYLVA